MNSAIIAIGTANPNYKSPQQKTADLVIAALNLKPSAKRLLKSVYKSTGIDYRYSVLKDYCSSEGSFEFFPNDADALFPSTAERMKIYKDNAFNLALSAIENCFSRLDNFNSNEITHVITVSCTGMYAPGIDIEIVQKLNLKSSTKRTAIQFMGCYGAFNALKIADVICKTQADATVLVVCVEICTIHFQKKTNLDNIIANSIFADGAAALLMQAEPKQKKYFSLETFHCDLLPQTNQAMAWDISDQGFDIQLSSYVPEIIEAGMAAFIDNLMSQSAIELKNIDFFAVHPGGQKILQATEKALNITQEQNKFSYQILRQFGNMSSATVLFVLQAIWNEVTQQDHHKNIFSCAFGPGLTFESMLLKAHCV